MGLLDWLRRRAAPTPGEPDLAPQSSESAPASAHAQPVRSAVPENDVHASALLTRACAFWGHDRVAADAAQCPFCGAWVLFEHLVLRDGKELDSVRSVVNARNPGLSPVAALRRERLIARQLERIEGAWWSLDRAGVSRQRLEDYVLRGNSLRPVDKRVRSNLRYTDAARAKLRRIGEPWARVARYMEIRRRPAPAVKTTVQFDRTAIWNRGLAEASGAKSMGELRVRAREVSHEMSGHALRSAWLDDYTCKACRELDGKVVKMGTPEFEEFLPPKKCRRKECRCVYIVGDPEEIVGSGPGNESG